MIRFFVPSGSAWQKQKFFRQLHRWLAPFVLIPMAISAVTGMGYRLGRSWFQLPTAAANLLLSIHQGAYLGPVLMPIYVFWVGMGGVSLILTGWVISRKFYRSRFSQSRPRQRRQWHGLLAPIVAIPLLVTTVTGMMYYFGGQWLGLPSQQTSLLLRIHQGSYLGPTLKVYYVLVLGLGVLLIALTGLQMTPLWRRWLARRHR